MLSAKLLEQKVPAIEPPSVCVCNCRSETRTEEPKIVDCVEVEPVLEYLGGSSTALCSCGGTVFSLDFLVSLQPAKATRSERGGDEAITTAPGRRGSGWRLGLRRWCGTAMTQFAMSGRFC